ncbi:hypothetical protein [Caenispirillum bisanense]|uniref:Uncharacterized protein n=1 Tax=Caenispirillum bisanense TaxID=414052 RepID=A0A286GK80_9PROT|nr:hypothetical protein [Caenispirillum bisanense]SOD95910.1 hypothetical protein SAMN05421508_10557 [Caenispirillum bisanense]
MTFSTYINETEGPPARLPLTHATDCIGFHSIMTAQAITLPEKCKVFNREIVYSFYGRPAYRVNFKDDAAHSELAYAPVCFVLNPSEAPVDAIYPFDTGGFERYRPFIHHNLTLEDFRLPGDIGFAQKIVARFFGSNRRYYDAAAHGAADVPVLEFAASAYNSLIQSQGRGGDDRNSCIEVQMSPPLDIRNSVLAVAMPVKMADNTAILSYIKSINATILPYRIKDRFRPIELAGLIDHLVENFYGNAGYLND